MTFSLVSVGGGAAVVAVVILLVLLVVVVVILVLVYMKYKNGKYIYFYHYLVTISRRKLCWHPVIGDEATPHVRFLQASTAFGYCS